MEEFYFGVTVLLILQISSCSASSVIIVEDAKVCFRRVLAGKRVQRAFVRKAVACERVEDCQRECSDERRFVCEGFNYRLDPAGRTQGDCELLDIPLSRLDIRGDVYDDPEYDYYEKDRNSDGPNCKGDRFYGSYGRYDFNTKYDYYDQRGRENYYGNDYRTDVYGHDNRQPRPGENDQIYYNDRRGGKNYNYYHDSQHYHYNHHSSKDNYDEHLHRGYHYKKPYDVPVSKDDYDYRPPYLPSSYNYKSYEPYLPDGYWKHEQPFYDSRERWDKYFKDRMKDKEYWGVAKNYDGWGSYGGSYGNFGAPDSYYNYDYYDQIYRNNNNHKYDYNYNDKKYYFVPSEYGGSKNWGQYGGNYGYSEQKRTNFDNRDSYHYWGFNKFDNKQNDDNAGLLPPYQDRPQLVGNYLPPYEYGHSHFDVQRHDGHGHHHHGQEHYDYHNVIKDECSLRMITGFRLHKGIVKKLISVPNIYECELLCYKETNFRCASYAFRYTIIANVPSENCYLSDRNYKELDHYTDLEPDRDCDIYTLNNRDGCNEPTYFGRDSSDCFWRVRSGQRLDQRIVRDSLNVKSILECQLECLKSYSFTCRAFSFRYGSPIIGGSIDNCQLTDWPFMDLDPRIHLIPENGYELYERGSYGHGCEPNHFEIGHKPMQNFDEKIDQLCYIGYGSPAKLLPQASKKTLWVETEADCKAECSRARGKSLFQCMSLSYQTRAAKGSPNCALSDIVQRDLLSNVDYVSDPDSWLFAWDIHNPQCVAVIVIGEGSLNGIIEGGGGSGSHWSTNDKTDHGIHGVITTPWFNPGYALETWKVYSVGGIPCKRGSLCQQNTVAGFWYCEIEGKEEHSWDYCCRPDHQCGYSEGFPYEWCYVGPAKTQWRKCNDHYYPYNSNANDRFDFQHHHSHSTASYLPDSNLNHVPFNQPTLNRPSLAPERPSKPISHNDYNLQHGDNFLDPPVPGGFGQPRYWPISYLHKENPPKDTSLEASPRFDYVKSPKGRNVDSKYAAITNLIDVIKSNDAKNEPYRVANTSSKTDEILYVKIPIPSSINGTEKSEKLTQLDNYEDAAKLKIVDLVSPDKDDAFNKTNSQYDTNGERNSRLYRRSYVTKTNKTLMPNRRRTKNSKGTVELLPLI